MADYMHQRLSSFPNPVEMERQIGKAFMMDGRSTCGMANRHPGPKSNHIPRFQQVPVGLCFEYPVPVPTTPPRLSLALGLGALLSPPDRKPKSRGTSGLGRNNQSVPSQHCDQRRAPVTPMVPMVPLRPVKNNSARSNVASPHRVHSSLSQTRPSSPFPAARRAAASIA